jgi:hypothetical protein
MHNDEWTEGINMVSKVNFKLNQHIFLLCREFGLLSFPSQIHLPQVPYHFMF